MNSCTLVELIGKRAGVGFPRIGASSSVSSAVTMMSVLGVSAMLVMREDGLLGGLFSDDELLAKVVAAGLDVQATPLSLVMNRGVRLVGPQVSVEQALEMLRLEGLNYAVVIEGAVVYGLLAMRDLVAEAVCAVETPPEVPSQTSPSGASQTEAQGPAS